MVTLPKKMMVVVIVTKRIMDHDKEDAGGDHAKEDDGAGDHENEDHDDPAKDGGDFLSSLKLTPVGDTNIPLPMMQPTIT